MKFISEATLDAFRTPGRCEVCGKYGPREPHHVFARGRGNASRMDIPENLLAVCVECHASIHGGMYWRIYLLGLIGQREGLWPQDLELTLQRLRNARKP